MADYEIKSGDNLYRIVAKQFQLKKRSDIMKMIQKVAKDNNIKNPDKIYTGQKIVLKDELRLNSVSIFNPETQQKTLLKDSTGNTNYYRATSVWGDIATKPEEFPGQYFTPSKVREVTLATTEVEDVITDVSDYSTSDEAKTRRDISGKDIASKAAQVSGSVMENSDAYKLFLQVNADDFTVRETEYKGKVEQKAFLDKTKSDGKIKVFSFEQVNGKEYLALRDNNGVVHYFDRNDNLKEVHFDAQEEATEATETSETSE
jgi:hypothetical protein